MPQGPLLRKHQEALTGAQKRPKIDPGAGAVLQSGRFRPNPVPPRPGPGLDRGSRSNHGLEFGDRRRDRRGRNGAKILAAWPVPAPLALVILALVLAFNGFGMIDDQGKREGLTGGSSKDSRQDRLKLALRENLKRRKSQLRGRGDAASASSEDGDVPLDDAGGTPSRR